MVNSVSKSGASLTGSSGDNEKGTPQSFFRWADRRFKFNYDPFSSQDNHLCKLFSTVDGTFRDHTVFGGKVVPMRLHGKDGLTNDWSGLRPFCNPPYGAAEPVCGENCIKKRCEQRGSHVFQYLPGFTDFLNKMYDARDEAEIIGALIKWDPSTDAARFTRTFADVLELPRIKYAGETTYSTFPSAWILIRPTLELIPRG